MEGGGIFPHILKLSTGLRGLVRFTSRPLFSRVEVLQRAVWLRYRTEKSVTSTENTTPIVQHVVWSLYVLSAVSPLPL
jgi:hypothetical protein